MDNIKDSCLICLTTKENDFEPIFLTNPDNISTYKSELALMYEDVFNLEIYDKIDFPQYMCPYCTLQLKLLSKFKKKAIDSYKIMEREYEIKNSLDNNIENIKDDKSEIFQNSLTILDIHETEEEEEETEIITTTSPEPETTIISGVDENDDMEVVIQEVHYDDFNTHNLKTNNTNEDEFLEVQFLENESIKDNTEDVTVESEPNNEIYYDITILSNISPSFMEEEIYEEYAVDSVKSEIKPSKKPRKYTTNNTKVDKKFQCVDCNIIFFQKLHLADHRKEKHPPFCCEICSKRFLSHDGYTSHMKVHMGLPGFKCEECGKTFNQKQHLIYHTQNYHSNERNFQCDLCSKRFVTISDLKIHMRVHNDERRYECDVCNKKFRANTHMTNHRYIHFEKCIECPHCHLKYASPSTLKTHIRCVHEGLCPYECKVCQKKFKRKHHLMTHLKTHKKSLPETNLKTRKKSLAENNEDVIIEFEDK